MYSILKNKSIWIAQKQGRSKDGNDFTDPSVLKMIHLNGRKTTVLTDYLNNINIINYTLILIMFFRFLYLYWIFVYEFCYFYINNFFTFTFVVTKNYFVRWKTYGLLVSILSENYSID